MREKANTVLSPFLQTPKYSASQPPPADEVLGFHWSRVQAPAGGGGRARTSRPPDAILGTDEARGRS